MSSTFEELVESFQWDLRAKNYDVAIAALENASEKFGSRPEYHEILGQVYLQAERGHEASDALREALKLRPKFETQFNYAEAAFLLGDFDVCRAEFRLAFELAPDVAEYRSIAAFKVIVSDVMAEELAEEHSKFEESLTDTGRHFLRIIRALESDRCDVAEALISLPEARASDSALYFDTLQTCGILTVSNE